MQRQVAKKKIEDADSDLEEERDLQVSDYLKCPMTMQKVDPAIMISNEGIR